MCRPRTRRAAASCRPASGNCDAVPMTLFHGDDVDAALAADDVDADVLTMADEVKIDGPIADAEAVDMYLAEELRQHGLVEHDLAFCAAHGEAETGLQQHEHGRGRPRLRRARDGVERRAVARSTREAAEELRQAMQLEERARVE